MVDRIRRPAYCFFRPPVKTTHATRTRSIPRRTTVTCFVPSPPTREGNVSALRVAAASDDARRRRHGAAAGGGAIAAIAAESDVADDDWEGRAMSRALPAAAASLQAGRAYCFPHACPVGDIILPVGSRLKNVASRRSLQRLVCADLIVARDRAARRGGGGVAADADADAADAEAMLAVIAAEAATNTPHCAAAAAARVPPICGRNDGAALRGGGKTPEAAAVKVRARTLIEWASLASKEGVRGPCAKESPVALRRDPRSNFLKSHNTHFGGSVRRTAPFSRSTNSTPNQDHGERRTRRRAPNVFRIVRVRARVHVSPPRESRRSLLALPWQLIRLG